MALGAAVGRLPTVNEIQQAAAKSAVSEVPRVGRMVMDANQSIMGEFAAWERDHNPEHLLHIITMQQAVIAAHAHSLVAVAQEAAASHGTICAIAHDLAQAADSPARLHGGMGAPVRRAPNEGADAAIERFVHQVGQGAAALNMHTGGIPPAGLAVSPVQLQAQMNSLQQLYDTCSNVMKTRHDMMMHAVGNMR